jgi:hypothetical protein
MSETHLDVHDSHFSAYLLTSLGAPWPLCDAFFSQCGGAPGLDRFTPVTLIVVDVSFAALFVSGFLVRSITKWLIAR